jgi:diacylglycerol kinase (ATP)
MLCLIANPAAGRGRARRAIPAARAALAAVADVRLRETRVAGDERRLVDDALDDGCTTIVALGGDGTWSKVASAIVASGSDCRLGLLAAGTGNDLAKSLAVPARDFTATARLIADGGTRRIDVGFVDGQCFVNAAGFGFDAAVLAAVAGRTWPRGDALYIAAALGLLGGYPGIDVSIGDRRARRHLMLVVANGQRFGGSFRIAPRADLADGALDLVSIANGSLLRRLRLFGAAIRGTHGALAEVSMERVSAIELSFAEPPIYEADGELCRAVSQRVEIRCEPAALRVVSASAGSSSGYA